MELEKYVRIIKMAILAYEEDGEANFSIQDIQKTGLGELSIRNSLKELCNQKLIENKTVSGYYSRYKLNYSGTCPSFIYSDLTAGQKDFLLRVNEVLQGDYTKRTAKNITRLLYPNNSDKSSSGVSGWMSDIKSKMKMTIFELLENWEPIHFKLEHPDYPIIKDSNGYKLLTTKGKKFKCQYCGETNPVKFGNSSITCRSCQIKRQEESKKSNIYRFIYNKAKSGYIRRPNIPEFSITEQDIKLIWEKQNKLDYYTGLPLEPLNMSLDRIDSSLGYTIDNICITSITVNVAKSDLSKEDFINLCKQVAKNFPD